VKGDLVDRHMGSRSNSLGCDANVNNAIVVKGDAGRYRRLTEDVFGLIRPQAVRAQMPVAKVIPGNIVEMVGA
jgi:hypothetical protein